MKKLMLLIAAIIMMNTGNVFAQSAQQAPAATQTAPAAKHMKKDGTPDMRYKENKSSTTHTKKDGTPDKRYKENKMKVAK